MAKPNLGEKDILNPSEAIEYFVLSRRKFYDLLKNTDGEDFLAYYGERKLIIRVAFEKYLLHHPELRRQVYWQNQEGDRQDATPNEEFFVRERVSEQMGNISTNIILMVNHILFIVGGLSQQTSCRRARNHVFLFGN